MVVTAVQTALDVLESLDKQFPKWKSVRIGKMIVILRFLRTFYLYAGKRCRSVHCESTLCILSNIDETVRDHTQEIQSVGLVSMDSDDQVISDAKKQYRTKVSNFFVCIRDTFLQEMQKWYLIFSDDLLQTSDSSRVVELEDAMDSLLENLQDLVQFMSSRRTSTVLIEELEGNVRFLRNFVMFATFRIQDLEHSQMKALLTFVERMVVSVARLTLMFRYDENPQTEHIYDLTKRIKPVESHVFGIYVEVLKEASKLSLSSHHSTLRSQRIVFGNFIDSLIFLLWELFSIDNRCADTFNYQMQNLYGDLTFLRTLLMSHQHKLDDLDEEMHDLIAVVICDAGILVCCLFLKGDEGEVENLDFRFSALVEKFKLIKGEEKAQKFPLLWASNLPQARLSEYDKTYSKMPPTSEYLVLDESVVGLRDEADMMIKQLIKRTKKLDIFSVVGMPGLGKTTFAKKVYNDPSIMFHFDVRSWCCVSQVYSKRSLLLEILGEVVDQIFNKSEDNLAVVLYRHLKGKRYLIVLDDLWDISAWNSLKLSFPDDANGSRILLTSRHHDVALQIKPDRQPYSLRSLTRDESWELLQKNIRYIKGCSPTLTSHGMEVVELCKGLPLMILIVAGILASMEEDNWGEVADGLRKGYELGAFIDTNKLHRLHVQCRREDFEESRLGFPHLHGLFLNADYEESRFAQHWYSIMYSFCQSRLLTVLDLRKINFGSFFPNVIELLVHLRYLALSIDGSATSPRIEVSTLTIPSWIQNLSNLETFILERCQLDVSLPESMWNMKQLRHLCKTGALGCWKFSKENHGPDLENVDTISTVFFSCGHTMKEAMSKFPNIRRLSCNLSTAATPAGDCRNLKLDFMTRLESLTMTQIQHRFLYLRLELPTNLKKLVISNFQLPWSKMSEIGKLPNLEILKLQKSAFVGKIWNLEEGTFTKLRFLKLAGLHLARWNWSESDGTYLPCLETLVLEGCRHLEEIPSGLANLSTLHVIEVFNCKSATHSIERIKEKLEYFGHGDVKIFFHTARRKR
ncbi:OLC1v1019121C1 [Oldenlandia corymbosa var. corymbosa]|uniref:OLC1v1019121C1 n=1 Tax=Oldenlandia corymbosa var. corymbosa TaxID=529605 RepID=A0AAV1EDB0_OLDCO|nr:OLC1v1019121C1 [Oldenlandia corymbosa var. corymbosa]